MTKKRWHKNFHRQFAHASSEKLLRLVNSTGSTWSQDIELKEKTKPICKNCFACLIFEKKKKKKTHNQLFSYHLLQTLRNVSLWTSNFTKERWHKNFHRQFAHASSEKLLRLVNSTGSTWSQDIELKEKTKPICKNCFACLIFEKKKKKKTHNQLFSYHLLQTLRNVSLWTSNFTKERFYSI